MDKIINEFTDNELKEILKENQPQIEISIAFDGETFEHECYCNNFDEAIKALKQMKNRWFEN